MIIDIHPPQVCPPPGQLLQNNQKSSHVIASPGGWTQITQIFPLTPPLSTGDHEPSSPTIPREEDCVCRVAPGPDSKSLELRPPKSRIEFLTVIQDATLWVLQGIAMLAWGRCLGLISLTAGISSAVCPPRPSPLPAKPENAPLRVDFLEEETGTHYLKISGSMLGLLNTFWRSTCSCKMLQNVTDIYNI